MTPTNLCARRDRANTCNVLLAVISTVGRRFFHYDGRVARFEVDDDGRVWLHDEYTEKRIYTHRPKHGHWRGFNHGGTFQYLVAEMRDFVTGKTYAVSSGRFSIGPEWAHDPWGYGADDMGVVYAAAHYLDISTHHGPLPAWVTTDACERTFVLLRDLGALSLDDQRWLDLRTGHAS